MSMYIPYYCLHMEMSPMHKETKIKVGMPYLMDDTSQRPSGIL